MTDEPRDATTAASPPAASVIAHAAMLAGHEQRLASARASAIAAGRRKGGLAGAAMAGAMLAVSDIIEGPPKDDAPVTVEASSDPHDVDRDGVDVTVGDVGVSAPPLERILPPVDARRQPRL